MALFLTEEEVAELLPMSECIEALDQAFAHAGAGRTEILPRSRIRMPNGFFHFMAAADAEHQVFGYKAYPSFSGPAGSRMMVSLYDYDSGQLLACIAAGRLGQIRTGAASGLATQYMARPESATVGVIGSGFQARTQLEAICTVRKIHQAKVYSRSPERREEFARQMSERLNLEVTPVDNGRDCVADADIVAVITSSRDPVLEGEWLATGTHINAAGGNHWMRREVDQSVVNRAEMIVVDDLDQAKVECGDLIWVEARGSFRWDMAHELQDVVAGRLEGRPSAQAVTLFESMGVALEDIAAAQLVYRKAKEQGIGQELPF